MESCLTHLDGSRSGLRYDADVLQSLDPVDGAPLLARYDLERASRTLTPQALAGRRSGGMWRWSELLPVRDRANVVYLGEGSTPLLPAPRLGDALGLAHLLIKAEGQNPTGAFKARGMAAAVSRAVELGARALIVPSAGNAGGALATYGAAAGVPVIIVLPADTPTVNITEAQIAGAHVVLVEGVISDCGTVARAMAAELGVAGRATTEQMVAAFDLSTLKEPYRVEGKKTMGLELAEELDWTLPDVVVYPTGGGTGLIGMWKAFDELQALGLIGPQRPRMVVAQAAGCAPMVRAIDEGTEFARPWLDPETRASGLRVPSAVGDRLILSAVAESGGTGVAVPESDIDRMQRLVARRGAGYVSPESATAFAATALLADEGWIGSDERVVVFDCGVGFKYPPPVLDGLPVMASSVLEDDEELHQAAARLVQSVVVGPSPVTGPGILGRIPATTPVAVPPARPARPTHRALSTEPTDPVRPIVALHRMAECGPLPEPPHREILVGDLPGPPR